MLQSDSRDRVLLEDVNFRNVQRIGPGFQDKITLPIVEAFASLFCLSAAAGEKIRQYLSRISAKREKTFFFEKNTPDFFFKRSYIGIGVLLMTEIVR